jgi:presqualene diphosphate synthase
MYTKNLSKVVKESHTSFYWAMRILPKPRREAMYAVYAFCRHVDDIADGVLPPNDKLAALAKWRDEIKALYEDHPTNDITRALAGLVRSYKLRQRDFFSIIDGMEMDAKGHIHGLSFDELDHYCDCVASAVGRLAVRVFGDDSPAADQVAFSLGRAVQLTNILRDIAEDASLGRLYLPIELLQKNGITTTDPVSVTHNPAVVNVCKDLAVIAEQHYRNAWATMEKCPRWAMRPARIIAGLYLAVLHRLMRSGWKHLEQHVHISKAQKLWVVLRNAL